MYRDMFINRYINLHISNLYLYLFIYIYTYIYILNIHTMTEHTVILKTLRQQSLSISHIIYYIYIYTHMYTYTWLTWLYKRQHIQNYVMF